MAFTQRTVNAFEMSGRMSAAEIGAQRPGHSAFVAVYPPDLEGASTIWRVRKFELKKELIDENFGQEELEDLTVAEAHTLAEVEQILASWKVDSASLDAAWKCDYPL